jgi:poly(3-hydroxybutyrate) depolymerase
MRQVIYLALLVCFAATVFALPRLNIDATQVSTSGLSSGAFFAVQFQVSFSKALKGAGIVAGGPFYCAKGSFITALSECMSSALMINVNGLADFTKRLTDDLRDPIEYLVKHQIYLFSGRSDTVVAQGVMEKLREYYQAMGVPKDQVEVNFNMNAQHSMVTNYHGNSCSYLGSPYINNCDYDLAGAILQHIHGSLSPRGEMKERNLQSFDQRQFFGVNNSAIDFANTGYVYIPDACQRNETCKLHIVFHGCKQNYDTIGADYVKNTGYNQWAESNNIVVLYPQTKSSILKNPNGCFDWWGYDDALYYSKKGLQISAVRRMVEGLTGRVFG